MRKFSFPAKYLLIPLVMFLVYLFATCQAEAQDEKMIPIDGDKGGGGFIIPDPGGGEDDTTAWDNSNGYPLGPWFGTFWPGGFLLYPDSCAISETGVTAYPGATFAFVVWNSALADSGHVRWDESGQTTWNYSDETGADSTSHYVVVIGLTQDYVQYDFQVRTGSEGCMTHWTTLQSFYTDCGDNTVSSYDAYYAGPLLGNTLEVDPNYKNKVDIQYRVKAPPGSWNTMGWSASFSTSKVMWNELSLLASTTYEWQYRLQDPCGEYTSWVSCTDFSTDGSGHIQ